MAGRRRGGSGRRLRPIGHRSGNSSRARRPRRDARLRRDTEPIRSTAGKPLRRRHLRWRRGVLDLRRGLPVPGLRRRRRVRSPLRDVRDLPVGLRLVHEVGRRGVRQRRVRARRGRVRVVSRRLPRRVRRHLRRRVLRREASRAVLRRDLLRRRLRRLLALRLTRRAQHPSVPYRRFFLRALRVSLRLRFSRMRSESTLGGRKVRRSSAGARRPATSMNLPMSMPIICFI